MRFVLLSRVVMTIMIGASLVSCGTKELLIDNMEEQTESIEENIKESTIQDIINSIYSNKNDRVVCDLTVESIESVDMAYLLDCITDEPLWNTTETVAEITETDCGEIKHLVGTIRSNQSLLDTDYILEKYIDMSDKSMLKMYKLIDSETNRWKYIELEHNIGINSFVREKDLLTNIKIIEDKESEYILQAEIQLSKINEMLDNYIVQSYSIADKYFNGISTCINIVVDKNTNRITNINCDMTEAVNKLFDDYGSASGMKIKTDKYLLEAKFRDYDQVEYLVIPNEVISNLK